MPRLGRRLLRLCLKSQKHPFAVPAQPQPFGVNGLDLQPLLAQAVADAQDDIAGGMGDQEGRGCLAG